MNLSLQKNIRFPQSLWESVLVLIFLNMCSLASAQMSLLPPNYLMEEAKDQLEAKNYSQSVVFLAQVLSSNPNFKSAQDLLNQLKSTNALSAAENADIDAFQNLNSFNNDITIKINNFLQKRNFILKNLESKGYQRSFLNNQLTQLQLELIQLREASERKISELQKGKAVGLKPLVALASIKRDTLIAELDNIEKQFNQLASVTGDQKKNQPVMDIVVVSPQVESGVQPQNQPENVVNQLSSLQQDILKLQQIVQEKDEKVNQLTKQLELLSNKINPDSSDEGSSSNAYVSQEDFNDLKSRFELSQKIIQNKDEEIQSLKKGNVPIVSAPQPIREQSAVVQRPNGDLEEQLIEVSGILEIYKGKFFDVYKDLKTNTAHMNDLEEKLTLVQNKLFEKDQMIEKAQESMKKLEEKLLELQGELDNLRESRLKTPLSPKDRISLQSQLDSIHEFLEVEWKDFQGNTSPFSNNISDLERVLDR